MSEEKSAFDSEFIGFENMEEENVEILTQLVTDPLTPEPLKIQILQKFIDAKKDMPFFDAMLEFDLDFGECPCCGHKNHWLVPEDEMNQRGIATHEIDSRVKPYTKAEDCGRYMESCSKKKVVF